jgi:hypothetical protein
MKNNKESGYKVSDSPPRRDEIIVACVAVVAFWSVAAYVAFLVLA